MGGVDVAASVEDVVVFCGLGSGTVLSVVLLTSGTDVAIVLEVV